MSSRLNGFRLRRMTGVTSCQVVGCCCCCCPASQRGLCHPSPGKSDASFAVPSSVTEKVAVQHSLLVLGKTSVSDWPTSFRLVASLRTSRFELLFPSARLCRSLPKLFSCSVLRRSFSQKVKSPPLDRALLLLNSQWLLLVFASICAHFPYHSTISSYPVNSFKSCYPFSLSALYE